MMDAKTMPQYWFQMPSKSTQELTQIWEAGAAVDDPELDLDLVEQVLMARHVLEPTPSFLMAPEVGFKEKPLADTFAVSQKIGQRMTRRWDVTLDAEQAIFRARDGNERFAIDRQKSRPEFQFKRSGFLLFSEDTSAFVRGKTFEFGEHKALLSAWLPSYSASDRQEEQTVCGIGLVLIGALTLRVGADLAPVLGSVLMLLGALNFIIHGRAIWLVNGLGWLANGLVTLGSVALLPGAWQGLTLIVSLFWLVLGLAQVILGFQAFQQFTRFRDLRRKKA